MHQDIIGFLGIGMVGLCRCVRGVPSWLFGRCSRVLFRACGRWVCVRACVVRCWFLVLFLVFGLWVLCLRLVRFSSLSRPVGCGSVRCLVGFLPFCVATVSHACGNDFAFLSSAFRASPSPTVLLRHLFELSPLRYLFELGLEFYFDFYLGWFGSWL